MGFGDRLKGLRDQAQQAVADNREKIQGAVQSVGEAANARTGGKYAGKIERVEEKLSSGVDKLGGGAPDGPTAGGAAATGAAGDATGTGATGTADTGSDESADKPAPGAPPEFE